MKTCYICGKKKKKVGTLYPVLVGTLNNTATVKVCFSCYDRMAKENKLVTR